MKSRWLRTNLSTVCLLLHLPTGSTFGLPVMLPQWATANRERQRALTESRTTIAGDPFYRKWLCGAGQGCRERLYIDNCLPLTVELFHQLAFSF